MIKNLAIKGGGVKGAAYVGAIKELDNANIFNSIERVSGTSAGALMACMICAGYSVAQIEQLMLSIKFNKFKGNWNPFRIFTGYGLYSGKYILKFVHDFLKKSPRNLKPNTRFSDMRNAGCKDLYVFACNTNMHDVTEFSADKTPDVIVAEAIRASMSIPFFFKAFRFSDKKLHKHIYIDGGVVYNYPLSFFDNPRFNKTNYVNFESVGLYLYTKKRLQPMPLRFSQPFNFSKQLFESLLETQDYVILQDKEQLQRSIMIDDLQILATDFNITPVQLQNLIDSGSKAAKLYITNNHSQNIKKSMA